MRPRSPFRFTTANLARLILSLIIAFAIWAFVTNERDPDRSRVVENVQVDTEGLPADFQIVQTLPEVDVTYKGPQSVVQNISDADVSAFVDLSDIDTAGDYEREVQVTDPGGLRAIEVDPSTVVVSVGSVVSKVFDITLIDPADPPATLTSISVTPSQVRIVGVQDNVERVARVEVPVQLSGRSESFSFTEPPVPVDSDGIPMDDTVRVEPSSVLVSVEFEVRAKSVPVIVQCACPNDDGRLEIRDLPTAIAIPPTVRVEGPEPLLAEINAVRTEPISIEELEVSDFIPNGAELDESALPEGVTIERDSVGVYVQVEQTIQEVTQDIEIVNAPPDSRVTLSPEEVSFEIQGPAETLATLSTEPPLVVIDLSNFTEGTHILAPRVVLPPDVRVVDLDPAEVQVTIELIPPTPTPTPGPSPTPEAPLSPNSSSLPIRQGPTAVPDLSNTVR